VSFAVAQHPVIPPEWRAARRILAVRLDNLGDVLVTSPALRAIKESLPGAELTLLAGPGGAQVGRLNPFVDRVMTYQAPWMDPWQRLPFDPARERRAIAALRARGFDAAVIFTSFRQSPLPAAYLCYLAGVPLRLGATFDGAGSLLTTRHKHVEGPVHEVERNLELVGVAGLVASADDLVLRVPDAARARVRARLRAIGRRGGPLVVLHPGCTMPARTYPWEQFADAADLMVEALGATVVLTGSADELPLVEQICGHMRRPARSLAGALSLPELCALVDEADLVVTNNTGPMHIAAAVKTPVVALFALTNPPEQWGPWRVPHRRLSHEVPCRICYSRVCPTDHACLREVRPAHVLEAARDLLMERPPAALGVENNDEQLV
jgi:lipopolysaccharide heptosyltransferase II